MQLCWPHDQRNSRRLLDHLRRLFHPAQPLLRRQILRLQSRIPESSKTDQRPLRRPTMATPQRPSGHDLGAEQPARPGLRHPKPKPRPLRRSINQTSTEPTRLGTTQLTLTPGNSFAATTVDAAPRIEYLANTLHLIERVIRRERQRVHAPKP